MRIGINSGPVVVGSIGDDLRMDYTAQGDTFRKARSGQGQVVGIVGEAGVGKSRLLLELRNVLPEEEYTFLEGHCLHYGGFMPYLRILDVLRSYIGIKEGEQESVIK